MSPFSALVRQEAAPFRGGYRCDALTRLAEKSAAFHPCSGGEVEVG